MRQIGGKPTTPNRAQTEVQTRYSSGIGFPLGKYNPIPAQTEQILLLQAPTYTCVAIKSRARMLFVNPSGLLIYTLKTVVLSF